MTSNGIGLIGKTALNKFKVHQARPQSNIYVCNKSFKSLRAPKYIPQSTTTQHSQYQNSKNVHCI